MLSAKLKSSPSFHYFLVISCPSPCTSTSPILLLLPPLFQLLLFQHEYLFWFNKATHEMKEQSHMCKLTVMFELCAVSCIVWLSIEILWRKMTVQNVIFCAIFDVNFLMKIQHFITFSVSCCRNLSLTIITALFLSHFNYFYWDNFCLP